MEGRGAAAEEEANKRAGMSRRQREEEGRERAHLQEQPPLLTTTITTMWFCRLASTTFQESPSQFLPGLVSVLGESDCRFYMKTSGDSTREQ